MKEMKNQKQEIRKKQIPAGSAILLGEKERFRPGFGAEKTCGVGTPRAAHLAVIASPSG